jgi:hypothetical protein
MRHAALPLWLNAGAPPAQITARAGHSVAVLLSTYVHCIDGQDEITNRQIEHALNAPNMTSDRAVSGATDRRSPLILSAICPPAGPITRYGPPAALCTPRNQAGTRTAGHEFPQFRGQLSISREREDLTHEWPTEHSRRST